MVRELGAVLEDSKCIFGEISGKLGCSLIWNSLAMAEMKILLKDVYSRYKTTIAEDMNASMELDDQIISSRPVDQCCKLVFEERVSR